MLPVQSPSPVAVAVAAAPRELTREVRAELDLPVVARAPYPWAFACVVVGTACIPLCLAKLWLLSVMAVGIGLVAAPAVRWFEYRDAAWRDDVYRWGVKTTARVVDIEPAGAQRRDHIVRIEFLAGGAMVRASIIGCPLARKGLLPDDHVIVLYAANRPARCLVVAKTEPEIVDAIFED